MAFTPVIDTDMTALFTVVNQQGEIVTIDLQEEASFSQHTLQQDMADHAAKYAYWSGMFSQVQRKQKEAEAYFEIVEARLSNAARHQLMQETGKAPAATTVASAIVPNQEYQDAKKSVSDWELTADNLKYFLKALDHRLSMMQQVSANTRKDIDNNIV